MYQSCEVKVRLSADLHARPAGQVVQTVSGFDTSVTFEFGGLEVDGRSVLALMRLGATAGNEVTVRASGPEAERALTALGALLGELSAVEARQSR